MPLVRLSCVALEIGVSLNPLVPSMPPLINYTPGWLPYVGHPVYLLFFSAFQEMREVIEFR